MQSKWWKQSTVYQIYPRSFLDSNGDGIGDLNGIAAKLDYLKELGIDVIWLSPVYDSPNDDNGYDVRDYQAIMKEFGTMGDWEKLVDGIHSRGMKLVMDLVVNHSSDEHAWFQASRQSRDNPYRDYYIWRDGKNNGPPNNWGSIFGGPAWEYDAQTDQYYLHLFSRKQPDLNWENPTVREEIYRMMRWWLDKGVDGFRMDVINFISKVPGLPDGPQGEGEPYGNGFPYFANGPRIHEFMQEMHEQVLSRYEVLTVGEMPGVTTEQAVLFTDPERQELDMVFQFEHMDLDSGPGGKWDLKPVSLVDLKHSLARWQEELEGRGWNSLYFNNHDQPRIVSRFGDDGRYRTESAKMLAACLHFMRGTPYVYQGEELGMTNVAFESIDEYRDIETLNFYQDATERQGWSNEQAMRSIYAKSRDNARTPMQWSADDNAGFTTGTPWISLNPNYPEVNANNEQEGEATVWHWYRDLIKLRKTEPLMVDGVFRLLEPEHEALFVYERELSGTKLLVICNFSEQPQHYVIGEQSVSEGTVLMANYDRPDKIIANADLELRPYEVVVAKFA